MNAEVKTLWVTALRSGEYQQTTGKLRSQLSLLQMADLVRYCCLGVLCDRHRILHPDNSWEQIEDRQLLPEFSKNNQVFTYLDYYTTLPEDVRVWAGLDERMILKLIDLNDDRVYNFVQIAEVIETQF